MRYAWMIGFTAIGLLGCVDTHTIRQVTQPVMKIPVTSSFYVAVPSDGKFDRITYTGSGKKAADTIASALHKHSPVVTTGLYPQSREDATAAARDAHATYLVLPTILHWEDRATGWSGRPDVVEMSVEVIDLAIGAVVASGSIGGKSRWGTLSDDKPEDLLPDPVNDYISQLF